MTATDPLQDSRLLAAALRWWDEMGVDTLVEETPQPWIGRAAVAEMAVPGGPDPAPQVISQAPLPPAVAAALPDQLPDFLAWFATDASIPDAGPAARRLAPFGTDQAKIAIITDMPETGDPEAGQLLSGPVGVLFDRMLAAIGLDRTAVYCMPLCPGRPPTGRLSDAALPRLGEIARHHLALTGATRVWLLGQATSRAILGVDATTSLDKFSQNINHIRGNLPCIASLHPRLLLQAPQRKAAVWKDMQALVEGLN